MEHREVADHRGQQARRPVRVAADGDGRKCPQLHQFRAVVDQAVGAQELGHPHVADRFEVRLRRPCGPASSPPTAGFSSRSTAGSEPRPIRVAA